MQSFLIIINNTTRAIDAGKAVCVGGTDDRTGRIKVRLADNSSAKTMPAIGITQTRILPNETGKISTSGRIACDTSGYSAGAFAFVGTNGDIVFVDPILSGKFSQQIGVVIKSSVQGSVQLINWSIVNKHAETHTANGPDALRHSTLKDLDTDSHKQYMLLNGQRPFLAPVSGRMPIVDSHLTTKLYVDQKIDEELDGYVSISTTGNQNKIPFFKDNSTVLDISSNLYWDASNERLGIGKIPISYRLEVDGSIAATENIGTTGSFISNGTTLDVPDYVFEKEYNLMPLLQLKGFVNEQKHLPEIPSANDKEWGKISLEQRDMLLLQKIEELCLYIFNLHDEMTELKNQVNDLSEKLK